MTVRTGTDACQQALDESRKRRQGKWCQLEGDGDSVLVAFLGEPAVRETIWEGGRSMPFTDEHRAQGKSPSSRFSYNVYNGELGRVQIFERGPDWYAEVDVVLGKKGKHWWYEVIRKGEKGDTKTIYKVIPDHEMTEQEKADIAKLKLYDLSTALTSSSSEADGDNDELADTGNGMIAEEDASKIIDELRAMPDGNLKSFLTKLEVKRIRDVPLSKRELAFAVIDSFKQHQQGNQEEIDPFA